MGFRLNDDPGDRIGTDLSILTSLDFYHTHLSGLTLAQALSLLSLILT